MPGNHDPPRVSKLRHNIYRLKNGGCLDILPSTLDLMYVALGQSEKRTRPLEERFSKFIVERRRRYEIVMIDCHPAGSILTKTSLQNSDHVVIPVAPDLYAVRGVGLMMRFIAANRPDHNAPRPHILFNNTQRRGVAPVEAQIRRDPSFAPFCLRSTLKHYQAFADPIGGKDFVWYSKKPWSTRAFASAHAVANELAERIDVSDS